MRKKWWVAASEQQLKALCERTFYDKDILAVYIDGIQFGDCHVIVAIGVDSGGSKHILGLREGCSENSRVATDLLNDLVDRGIRPDRLRLFVIGDVIYRSGYQHPNKAPKLPRKGGLGVWECKCLFFKGIDQYS